MSGMELLEKLSLADAAFIEEAERTAVKKHNWIKWAVAACLVLAMAAAFFPKPASGPVVNQLSEPPASADLDVQIGYTDKLPYDVWQQILADFHASTGLPYDDFVARLPGDLQEDIAFYTLSTRGYKNGALEDAYRLHDYVFDCKAADGAWAVIALCGFEAPLRDLLIEADSHKSTDILGTAVTIYQHGGMYIARFSQNGVHCDVCTTGMDLPRLEALLNALLTA